MSHFPCFSKVLFHICGEVAEQLVAFLEPRWEGTGLVNCRSSTTIVKLDTAMEKEHSLKTMHSHKISFHSPFIMSDADSGEIIEEDPDREVGKLITESILV